MEGLIFYLVIKLFCVLDLTMLSVLCHTKTKEEDLW